MPRLLNISNEEGRDARVQSKAAKAMPGNRLGRPDIDTSFRRFLSTTQSGLHEELQKAHGDDYADALIEGDPETDIEQVGRRISTTHTVYLSGDGDVLHAPPEIVELILDPFGEERERRTPQELEANVNDAMPVRWRRRRLARTELVRRFAIKRTLQVRHDSGITYDYLYKMAAELDEAGVVVLMGAGEKGSEPLRFTQNGSPYQAFLEGRVDGPRYKLLLHLSDMELKPLPENPAAGGTP
ncbi:MAG: hypothetical protein KDA24_15995 [Deltaproteobacteria bacterium]|nr:hypothetical protein [Deltaproteobacteria bacterium]